MLRNVKFYLDIILEEKNIISTYVCNLMGLLSSLQDYKLLAKRLRNAVERYRIDVPAETELERYRLPLFPRTELRGDEVVIIWDDMSEQVWDNESDKGMAAEVAEEIQLELRAIKYVKLHLIDSLSNVVADLKEFNVKEEDIGDIVYEGYQSIRNMFINLDNASNNNDQK